ncbi:hypothetical protein BN9982_20038 [Mycobacterium tuberculosis]|nr:hypothetical protein BN9982_20038 [Mycobacterium tuberculosis]
MFHSDERREHPEISRTLFGANGRGGPEQAGSVGAYTGHGNTNGDQEVGHQHYGAHRRRW